MPFRRNGHLYVIQLLLSRSANPELQDAQGFNTLHLVTHSSAVMPLLYLLRQPIGVDDRDTDGHTSLMWAAWQGSFILQSVPRLQIDAVPVSGFCL
jgi:ankyrin repeat protein